MFVHIMNIKDVPENNLNTFIDSCQKENCKCLLHENALVVTSNDNIEEAVKKCFDNFVHVYKIEVI